MTTSSAPQTIRLACLTSSLPDEAAQGRIPPREARSIAHIPATDEAFSFLPLPKPLRLTRIILAEDCLGPDLPGTCVAVLKDRDYGAWHGRALRDLPPDAVQALVQDWEFAPPEGESQRQFQERISQWLSHLTHPEADAVQPIIGGASSSLKGAYQTATLLLIARPAVVRALAGHILQGGPDMAARLDIAPQTISLFTYHADLWRVRMLGAPCGP